jgi:hypothetical protein
MIHSISRALTKENQIQKRALRQHHPLLRAFFQDGLVIRPFGTGVNG